MHNDVAYSILNYEQKVETCSTKESNELFSGQDIGKARMLESEESHKTLLEVSGRGENEEEEETSARKVEKE